MKFLFARSEVFTAVTMKNAVFWDVGPCISKRRFTQELHGPTPQKTAFFKFRFV
jgi:hypothetical protein